MHTFRFSLLTKHEVRFSQLLAEGAFSRRSLLGALLHPNQCFIPFPVQICGFEHPFRRASLALRSKLEPASGVPSARLQPLVEILDHPP